MVDIRAICATCGHTRQWHDRVAATAQLGSEPGIERPCYREVGGAPCRCDGFRESGELALRAAGAALSRDGVRAAQIVAVGLLLVVLGLMLLYAYRSQRPAVTTVPLTAAIQDVQAGRVRAITMDGGLVTLELANGSREQTTVPQPDDVFAKAVLDYNAANPARQVNLRYEKSDEPLGTVAPLVLALLPFLLIVAVGLLVLRAQRRT